MWHNTILGVMSIFVMMIWFYVKGCPEHVIRHVNHTCTWFLINCVLFNIAEDVVVNFLGT